MANIRLSGLTELTTPASGDLLYIVDISDTTDNAAGSSRKITATNLFAEAATLNTNLVTLTGSQTLTNKTLTAPIITSPVLTTPQINDTSADHQYIFAVNELAADRTITLPLLTGNDTFVFNDHIQTLTNKTITSPKINQILDTDGDVILGLGSAIGTVVNYVSISNSITNNPVSVNALGTDSNIDLELYSKGSGVIAMVNASSDTIFEGKSDRDVNLPLSTANIQVAGADPKRAMYIPASAMYPSTTAGCAALAQVESTTNDVNIKVLAFDGAGTSKEYAEFGVQSPFYWDASTVTAQFIWYAAAGSGTVNWEIQGLALADDDALDTAYGTLQEVTDTVTAAGDVMISAETSAITVANSPAAGDWLQLKVARDPANDTDASDALLIGIHLRFGVKQYNDTA